MSSVKYHVTLNPDKLVVPTSLASPELKEAGLAWLDMAVELFNTEVFSVLSLTWTRPLAAAPVMTISFDSSLNAHTKGLVARNDAPPMGYNRRERLDAAMKKLLSKVSAETLWAALANQPLADIGAWEFIVAWDGSVGQDEARTTYPRFRSGAEMLFNLMKPRKQTHPWS